MVHILHTELSKWKTWEVECPYCWYRYFLTVPELPEIEKCPICGKDYDPIGSVREAY